MRKRSSRKSKLIYIILLECGILLLLGIWAMSLLKDSGESVDPTDSIQESTSATTEPTETEPSATEPEPSATIADATEPTQPPVEDEMIGSLYTRTELLAMSSESLDYGPGVTSGGQRPPYPDGLQAKYGKYGANFIAPETDTVYLTFDCGWEYSFENEEGKTVRVTEWILDTLKEKNVKAVFFVTLSYCEKNADLVERMIAEGHAVGNHSAHHPNSMAKISIDEMVDEVMTLHNYVQEHFGYQMHLFRPPTGAYSEQSLAVVQSLGYKTVHWSFAYADWDPEKQPTVESGYQTVTERHHKGAIYLLHAVSVTNATILGDVIDFLQGEGYQLELFQ